MTKCPISNYYVTASNSIIYENVVDLFYYFLFIYLNFFERQNVFCMNKCSLNIFICGIVRGNSGQTDFI